MSRYVLTFNKKGNMRFISHLDMQRLFRRVLYRYDIPVSFSQGFNPHPITNIVQPLSLGFEAECDYFEFESKSPLDASSIAMKLNGALPEGIKFTKCKEIPHEKRNLSSVCEYSEYSVFIPNKMLSEEAINRFLSQNEIYILKRDKKTKQMIEKNIKNWIYSFSVPTLISGGTMISMILRAAPNETLNPLSLTESLMKYLGEEIAPEEIRITRIDLYYLENNLLKSLFDRNVSVL